VPGPRTSQILWGFIGLYKGFIGELWGISDLQGFMVIYRMDLLFWDCYSGWNGIYHGIYHGIQWDMLMIYDDIR
jgi:hypothetical protein